MSVSHCTTPENFDIAAFTVTCPALTSTVLACTLTLPLVCTETPCGSIVTVPHRGQFILSCRRRTSVTVWLTPLGVAIVIVASLTGCSTIVIFDPPLPTITQRSTLSPLPPN